MGSVENGSPRIVLVVEVGIETFPHSATFGSSTMDDIVNAALRSVPQSLAVAKVRVVPAVGYNA